MAVDPQTDAPADAEVTRPGRDVQVLASERRRDGTMPLAVPGAGAVAGGVRMAAEQAKHVTITVVVALALAVAGAVAFTSVGALQERSLVFLVAIVGTVGGIANNYRRLQNLARQTGGSADPSLRVLATTQIYLSPLIGSVFAVLLYGVFMSGLLAGEFFPSFGSCASEVFSNLDSFSDCSPATNADAARALIWAFIAGFAEAFVPNFIGALARGSDAE